MDILHWILIAVIVLLAIGLMTALNFIGDVADSVGEVFGVPRKKKKKKKKREND